MDQNNMGGFAPLPDMAPNGANNGFQTAPAGNAPLANSNDGAAPAPTGFNPAAATIPPAAPNYAPIPPASTTPVPALKPEKKGNTLAETLVLVGVCLIAAVAIVFAVIFFMQYNELKTNYDSDKNLAVSAAVKEQQDKDEATYEERNKLPYASFTGPSDYGSISFEYPKNWSVYVDKDGTKNTDYVAYFAPSEVSPVSDNASRYALRFQILNRQITSVQSAYETKLKNGKLTAKAFTSDDNALSGTWYEGELSEGINGIALLLKVNDKTLIMQTDTSAYRADFELLTSKLRRNS